MSNLNDAADYLRRHIKGLEMLQAAAGIFDRIASIEQAEAEAKARLDAIGQEAAALEARVAKLKAEEPAILLAREQDRIEHEHAITRLTEDAEARAAATGAQALKAAADAVAAATAQAQNIIKQAESDAASAIMARDQAVGEAEAALQAVQESKATLADIKDKIAKAKAAAASILAPAQ